ncbi:MAG: D-aminoacyl-tRNA deacylase, partial [Candidatus Woesearchaeota archaeon]
MAMVQCILASRQDPASATLATQLLEHPLLKTRRLFPNQIQVWKNCAVEIEGYLLERFQETKNALEIKRVPTKKSLHTTDQAYSEKSAGAIPLVITNHELLFLDDIDQLINKVLTQTFEKPIIIDLLLVLSKHSSKHPFPSLSVHSIGNFEDAELGGKPNMLVPSSAKAMLFGLKAIEAAANVLQAQSNVVQAFQEVTHHGPWVSTPTIFFEIGA